MFDSTTLIIFITAALALLLSPGPAVLYIVARSLEQGRLAGIISTLGIAAAGVVHVTFAALGLSALLMQSAFIFSLVKYLGAAYLIYLGVRTLMRKPDQVSDIKFATQSLSKIFRQGFVVNLLNPKTALFFLAFLPQFVSPSQGSVTAQILILGAIFVGLALISDGLYALVAGTARQFLAGNPGFAKMQKRVAGIIYIALGVTTAISGGERATP
ncbi:MAG: LysE family translocator [Chloroflexota bacterium]